jgi:hypothetical protein
MTKDSYTPTSRLCLTGNFYNNLKLVKIIHNLNRLLNRKQNELLKLADVLHSLQIQGFYWEKYY